MEQQRALACRLQLAMSLMRRRLLKSLQESVSLEVLHLLLLQRHLARNDDAKFLLSLLLGPFHLLLTCTSPCLVIGRKYFIHNRRGDVNFRSHSVEIQTLSRLAGVTARAELSRTRVSRAGEK